MIKKLTALIAILMLAGTVAACGKKAPPKAPGGDGSFPKSYPTS